MKGGLECLFFLALGLWFPESILALVLCPWYNFFFLLSRINGTLFINLGTWPFHEVRVFVYPWSQLVLVWAEYLGWCWESLWPPHLPLGREGRQRRKQHCLATAPTSSWGAILWLPCWCPVLGQSPGKAWKLDTFQQPDGETCWVQQNQWGYH